VIRIVLADDQRLVRGGFRMILDAEPDLEVVGEADDGAKAVQLVRELAPDVVLLDIRMPVLDGIAAAGRILDDPSPPRVVMVTTFDLDSYVYDALRAGASGFLLKTIDPDGLVTAVRTVAEGNMLVAPELTRRLVEAFTARGPAEPSALVESLSPRELDVVARIGRGMTNAEIAADLFLGEATIKSHVNRILAKLHLRDRVQIVIASYETGMLVPRT
jgi:DNA-binding NarL/FixJ family response regulator